MRTKLLTVLLLVTSIVATIGSIKISQNITKRNYGNLSQAEVLSDEKAIGALLSQKLDMEVSDLAIDVTQDNGKYAIGNFTRKDSDTGGAYWLAAKKGGNWKIIKYGSGALKCSVFNNYPDFPLEMVSQCVDEYGNITQRTD